MARSPAQGALRQAGTMLVLIVLPVGLFVWFMWHLHTPSPRPKTSVVITRNSLLPHRFAGPCLNCHRIVDVGIRR